MKDPLCARCKNLCSKITIREPDNFNKYECKKGGHGSREYTAEDIEIVNIFAKAMPCKLFEDKSRTVKIDKTEEPRQMMLSEFLGGK